MIRNYLLLFICASLSWSVSHAGGNGVSNGGGFAICADRLMYSYDYLLTSDIKQFGADVTAEHVQSSLLRISSHLYRLQDPLAKEFEIFATSMFTQKAGAPYQWFERQNLRLMYEPELESALPPACKLRKQAVYFTAPFAGVPYASYAYDPHLIGQVLSQSHGALQVSYLWVHEWLWNYFSHGDFKKVAYLNRLLHSEKLSTLSPQEYAKLRSMMTESRSPAR